MGSNLYQVDANVSGPSGAGYSSPRVNDPRISQVQEAGREAMTKHEAGPLSAVASQISRHWQEAQNAKSEVEDEMIREQYERNDRYTPQQKEEIRKSNTPEIFMPLTSTKADALVAWIKTTISAVNPGERFWDLEPTPIPEMPDDIHEEVVNRVMQEFSPLWEMGQMIDPVMAEEMAADLAGKVMVAIEEEAELRASRMATQIEDQLVEGGFYQALDEMIDDMGHAKTAFIRGPILIPDVRLAPMRQPDGSVSMQMKQGLKFHFHRVNQLDVYPAPNSRGVNDRYLFYRMQLTKSDLYAIRGAKGVNTAAVDMMLVDAMMSPSSMVNTDSEREEIENRDNVGGMQDAYDVLEYWGDFQGSELVEWGIEGINDVAKVYQVQAWYATRTRQVIRLVLNPNPNGKRPFFATGVHKVNDAFWHRSLVSRSHNDQKVLNAYFRAFVDNLSHAATETTVYNDISRLGPNQKVTTHFAKKVYAFEPPKMGATGRNEPPVQFHQTKKLDLMREIAQIYELAELHTGIPNHIAGVSPGAGTASGMAMQLDSAGKKVRDILGDLDNDIIKPIIEWMFFWNMQFNPREDIKGDFKAVPRGALAALRSEGIAAKINQVLAATANPMDMQIVGQSGRAEMLRESLDSMNLDTRHIIPDDKIRMLRKQDQMANMLQAGMLAAPGGPQGAGGGPGMDNPDDEGSIQTGAPPSITQKPNTPIETPAFA
jgi:hypothetical protein